MKKRGKQGKAVLSTKAEKQRFQKGASKFHHQHCDYQSHQPTPQQFTDATKKKQA